MSKRVCLSINLGIIVAIGMKAGVGIARAEETVPWAAYAERISAATRLEYRFFVPPEAEVIIVNQNNDIYTTIKADTTGNITRDIAPPESEFNQYKAFFSDGVGISSSVAFDFTKNIVNYLLPPTIYGVTSIEKTENLGFIGKGHPLARVELEIQLSTNEKKVLETLADNKGEWQIRPINLPPGRHEARAKLTFNGMESQWSQSMTVNILTNTDRIINDLGVGTRRSMKDFIQRMPGPAQELARKIDQQSGIVAKYVLPTLFTLTTITQSGVLAQNVIYVLFQALLAIGQAMGIIKKKQPIGVVYDAVSKQPVGRAIVRLYEAISNRLIETDVTSATGTFSFMPAEGYYYIKVSKPGFIYPSQLIISRRDGRFSPIYNGGDIKVSTTQAVVNVAVPLDPDAYQEKWLMRTSRSVRRWFEPLNQWLLWLGLFLAFLSYTRIPNRLNFFILWLYCLGLVYFWWQGRQTKRQYGLVTDNRGKPVSGIELVLMDVEFNRLVSRRTTDEKGRFQFITPPGRYQIRVVSTGWELVTTASKAYKGDELLIEGERGQVKHLAARIMVKEN